MNVVKTVLLTSVTLCIIGQTAYAAQDCSHEERSVRVTRSKLTDAREDIAPLDRKLKRLQNDARDIRSKYRSALSAQNSAERALRELRDTNYNAEEYIASNQNKINSYKKTLSEQKRKADAQKKKYKRLSKWNPKRILAKSKFKKLQRKVESTQSSIRSHEYRIIKINDIVSDFDFLEDDAIARVDYAEVRVENTESDLPEAERFERRAQRLKREIRDERDNIDRLARRVEHAKDKLQACLAE